VEDKCRRPRVGVDEFVVGCVPTLPKCGVCWNLSEMPFTNMEDWKDHFKRECEDQFERYGSEILPLYIEKYYFGGGHYFVAKMLTDLDSSKIQTKKMKLSRRSSRLAVRALENCPLRIVDRLEHAPEGLVMGRFIHHEQFEGSGFGGTSEYRELLHERTVELYGGSFFQLMKFQLMNSGQFDLSNEILTTIFHEYIHFFESFFLNRDQPLATRERSTSKAELLSLRKAITEDRIVVAKKILWKAGVILAFLGITYVLITNRI
jgi:hypothetical protein